MGHFLANKDITGYSKVTMKRQWLLYIVYIIVIILLIVGIIALFGGNDKPESAKQSDTAGKPTTAQQRQADARQKAAAARAEAKAARTGASPQTSSTSTQTAAVNSASNGTTTLAESGPAETFTVFVITSVSGAIAYSYIQRRRLAS